MNEGNLSNKDRVMKTFAVVGFALIIVFLVWLAIQIVSLLPGAFGSLAKMAEDVYNRERTPETIVIEAEDSVVNSKESFRISWNETNDRGRYALQYDCTDGVSLDARLPNGVVVPVDCGSLYQLPNDTFYLDLSFASEKERFSDLSYAITFTPEGQSTTAIESRQELTLINASIPPEGIVAGSSDETDTEDPVIDTPADNNDQVDNTDDSDNTPVSNPEPETRYRYVYQTTYQVPVSDPNGYTELAVTYMGIGVVNSFGQFIPQNRLDTNDFGAFQFKVKNIGTKTSSTWSYEADLPTNATYDSNIQTALKPNEEALITVAFGRVHDEGTERFGVEIDGGNDISSANNQFTATVRIDD